MDVLYVLLVSLENAIDAFDLRLVKVTVQWEAMACLLFSHESRYASKAEAREVLIVVILLKDVSDLLYGARVVVIATTCVKRAAVIDLPI